MKIKEPILYFWRPYILHSFWTRRRLEIEARLYPRNNVWGMSKGRRIPWVPGKCWGSRVGLFVCEMGSHYVVQIDPELTVSSPPIVSQVAGATGSNHQIPS